MKKLFSIFCLLSFNLILISCNNQKKEIKNSADSSQKNQLDVPVDHSDMDSHKLMNSMDATMREMENLKMTGNYDLDFANMMILHHKAAVKMSEVEIKYGKDKEIVSLAKDIIKAQQREISIMENFSNVNSMKEQKKQTPSNLNIQMKKMMENMMAISPSGNIDKDYVMMMIPHHEGAILMAENELVNGRNMEMKKLSESIIADQNKEIRAFKNWLKNQK